MATVTQGSSIKLTARFYDYQSGPLVDPDSGPNLDILFNNASVLSSPVSYPGDIVRDGTGVYSYTYSVPSGASKGQYRAHWTAVQDGVPIQGEELFSVVSPSEIVAGTGTTLGQDYEINYIAEMDPAFIDPDEIMAIFPTAEATMVLESIHRVSLQILGWIPNATAENLSPLLQEYLLAAIACDLSQRYGLSSSDEYSITLGDLSVTYDQSQSNSGLSGDADWCALAAALRLKVQYGLTSMKGVVRGSRLSNPIPRRSMDKKRVRIHLQGTLDDVEGTPHSF